MPLTPHQRKRERKKDQGRAAVLGNPRCINNGDSWAELHCVCLQDPLKQKSEADGVPEALEWDFQAHLMVSQPGTTD